MLTKKRKISPLFSVTGVENTIFRVDWLHAVDQGVGADFLGNIFELFLTKLPGNSRSARCAELWQEVVKFYETHSVKDQMKQLLPSNIRESASKAPKLRGCNAASCRSLIPFASIMAQKLLSDAVPKEQAAKKAAHHLLMVLQSLSESALFRTEVMQHCSTSFALLFASLRDTSEDPDWRVKPKMHLFLELCLQECEPNLFWTYRDEDFGGSIGHQSKMRGSWKRASSYMKHALDLFACKNPEPRLLN